MTKDIDIFEKGEGNIVGEWFAFREVGDKIQGTYVDVRKGEDSFKNPQMIYVLKKSDGTYWNIGTKITPTSAVIERMSEAKLGDIVGFALIARKDIKSMPGKKWNDISVFRNSKIVDEEWLANHPDRGGSIPRPKESENVAEDNDEIPFEGGGQEKKNSIMTQSSLDIVRTLANAKGLTSDEMNFSDIDSTIEFFTGLELTEENLPQLIVKVSGYQK